MAISVNRTSVALAVVGLSLSVISAIIVIGRILWLVASWTLGLRRVLGYP